MLTDSHLEQLHAEYSRICHKKFAQRLPTAFSRRFADADMLKIHNRKYALLSDFHYLYASVGRLVVEAVVLREQSGIYSATDKHSGMGKDGNAGIVFLPEFVEETSHTAVNIIKALAVGGTLVHVVFIPLLQVRVVYLVVAAHLPVAHVHLLQSVVLMRIVVTASLCQPHGTRERRREDGIEGLQPAQVFCRGASLVGKSVGKRHVAPTVACARSNAHARMSYHYYFHNSMLC